MHTATLPTCARFPTAAPSNAHGDIANMRANAGDNIVNMHANSFGDIDETRVGTYTPHPRNARGGIAAKKHADARGDAQRPREARSDIAVSCANESDDIVKTRTNGRSTSNNNQPADQPANCIRRSSHKHKPPVNSKQEG